ncbi:MAG: DUF4115 domain-containing protein [Betaproteobacteria bacterium]|jgi:cytoskeleton protein RodZ|nr:DUF4115 domain-containing protein [Betaproteobacteria bacterium]
MTDPTRIEAAPAPPPDAPAAWHSPGARLAEARAARGLSVEAVAHQLKFAPRQIVALEQDRFDELPGVTVVRGMLRGYARLVDLDPEPLLASLGDSVSVPDANRIIARYREPVPFSDGSKRSNVVYLVFTLAVLAVAAVVLLQWRQDRPEPARMSFVPAAKPAPESDRTTVASVGGAAPLPLGDDASSAKSEPAEADATAPSGADASAADARTAQDETPGSPAVDAGSGSDTPTGAVHTAAASGAGEAAPATPAGAHRVELEFGEESWVEVRDADGKVVFSQLNAPGSKASVEGAGPLSFVIGNAQSVRLTFDGQSVDLAPYTKVAVARFTLQ